MTMILTTIMRVMSDDACASLSPQHRAPGCEQRPLDTEPEPEPVSAWQARWPRHGAEWCDIVTRELWCAECDNPAVGIHDSCDNATWHTASPECYIVCCITLELVRRAVRVVTLRVMSFKDCLFLLSSSDIWYIDLLNISIEEQAWTDSWLISIIHSIVLSVMMATDIFKSSLHAIIFKKL